MKMAMRPYSIGNMEPDKLLRINFKSYFVRTKIKHIKSNDKLNHNYMFESEKLISNDVTKRLNFV